MRSPDARFLWERAEAPDPGPPIPVRVSLTISARPGRPAAEVRSIPRNFRLISAGSRAQVRRNPIFSAAPEAFFRRFLFRIPPLFRCRENSPLPLSGTFPSSGLSLLSPAPERRGLPPGRTGNGDRSSQPSVPSDPSPDSPFHSGSSGSCGSRC